VTYLTIEALTLYYALLNQKSMFHLTKTTDSKLIVSSLIAIHTTLNIVPKPISMTQLKEIYHYSIGNLE
jgi:hypothetical protein